MRGRSKGKLSNKVLQGKVIYCLVTTMIGCTTAKAEQQLKTEPVGVYRSEKSAKQTLTIQN